MSVQKSTGWKVPLLFCLVIASVVLLGAFFVRRPAPSLRLPPALMQAMQSQRIELSATEDGRSWQTRITSAASGFADASEKDGKIRAVLVAAVEAQRFDAACTASVLVQDSQRRDAGLERIANRAVEACPSLIWAGMAVAGMRSRDMREKWEERLAVRWNECQRSSQ